MCVLFDMFVCVSSLHSFSLSLFVCACVCQDDYPDPPTVDDPLALWVLAHPLHASEVNNVLMDMTDDNGKQIAPEGFKTDMALTPDQATMLRDKLRETTNISNVEKVHIVYQHAGQVVTVPSGWIHCVRNLRPCIKIAHDFMRPHELPLYLQAWRQIISSTYITMGSDDFGGIGFLVHKLACGRLV